MKVALRCLRDASAVRHSTERCLAEPAPTGYALARFFANAGQEAKQRRRLTARQARESSVARSPTRVSRLGVRGAPGDRVSSGVSMPPARAIVAITLWRAKELWRPASRNHGRPAGSMRKSKRPWWRQPSAEWQRRATSHAVAVSGSAGSTTQACRRSSRSSRRGWLALSCSSRLWETAERSLSRSGPGLLNIYSRVQLFLSMRYR